MKINYYELIRAIRVTIINKIRAGATKQDIENHKELLLKQWKHQHIQHYIKSIDYDEVKILYKL